MRILGIDPGTKRCGVAITNSAETMAFPRQAIVHDENFEARVATLVAEEGVELVVVGRPLSLAGRSTASTGFAHDLVERLRTHLAVAVVEHDERLTTSAAQRSLLDAGVSTRDQRDRVDSAAAVVMLQHFVDVRRVV